MKRMVYTFCLLVGLATSLQAQDPMYTQYISAPLQINPALAGVTQAPRFILHYRNQWPGFNQAYSTYSVTYDQNFPRMNSGVGLNLQGDNAGNGIYNTYSASLFFSYNLQVADDFYVKAGLEGGVVQTRLDWDRLIFFDQLDPITGPVDGGNNPNPTGETRPDELNKLWADVGAGLLVYNPYFAAGLSIKHINSPNEGLIIENKNFGNVPIRFTAHLSGEIPLPIDNNYNQQPFLSPNLLVVKQGEFYQITPGAYASLGMFYGGLWYRITPSNSDAAIALVGFQKDMFKIGYSYDFTVSGLSSHTAGSHEVSVTINLDNNEAIRNNRNRKRYLDCLQIFK